MARRVAFAPYHLADSVIEEFAARARKAARRSGVAEATADFKGVLSGWERLDDVMTALAESRPESLRLVNGAGRAMRWDYIGYVEHEEYSAHGEEIAEALARATGFDRVTAFEFSESALGAEGMRTLLSAKAIARVSRLDLSGNAFAEEPTAQLFESTLMPRLESLSLARNPLGDEGVDILVQHECTLDVLDLSGCKIGERGVQLLANAASFVARLRSLRLSGNYVDDAGAMRLRERYGDRVVI